MESEVTKIPRQQITTTKPLDQPGSANKRQVRWYRQLGTNKDRLSSTTKSLHCSTIRLQFKSQETSVYIQNKAFCVTQLFYKVW